MNPIDYVKKIIALYVHKFQKDPSSGWVLNKAKTKFNISKKEFNDILRKLISEKFLIEVSGRLTLNPKVQFQISDLQEEPALKVAPEEKSSEEKLQSNHFIEKYVRVVQSIFGFIGLAAMYMSAYYVNEWMQNFLNSTRSMIFSGVVVSFAVLSFELTLILRREKKKGLMRFSLFLWALVTIFSTTSTIAGQYSARMEDVATQKEAREKHSKAVSSQKADSGYLEDQEQKKERASGEIERIDSILKEFNTTEKISQNEKLYKNTKDEKAKWEKEEKKLSDEIRSLKKAPDDQTPVDFYDWVSMVLGVKAESIQFWLSIFPAIFIDVVAPFSFAMILVLSDLFKK